MVAEIFTDLRDDIFCFFQLFRRGFDLELLGDDACFRVINSIQQGSKDSKCLWDDASYGT